MCHLPAHEFRVLYVLELGNALVVFGLLRLSTRLTQIYVAI
jgi:hypothetical protein